MNQPRLIEDIFVSNCNTLIASLQRKAAYAQRLRHDAKEGGDYEHTITAFLNVLGAAKNAAEYERDKIIAKSDQEINQ